MNKTKDHRIGILSQSGFTIIEIMIAITVFAIGLLGINIMQTSSITGNSAAKTLSGRTTWASDQIEQIISWNYSDPRLTDDGNTTTFDGTTTSPDNQYSISWQVTDNSPILNAKTINITVSSNDNKTVTFSYVKSDIL